MKFRPNPLIRSRDIETKTNFVAKKGQKLC